jgi:hypothetical protein
MRYSPERKNASRPLYLCPKPISRRKAPPLKLIFRWNARKYRAKELYARAPGAASPVALNLFSVL